MLDGRKILGLIPARAGSRGLPGKNIKILRGKSLIGWTIEAAKASRYLDDIVVSTDDKVIAGAAGSYGARVPFIRPPDLATDGAKMIDVVIHCIDTLAESGSVYDVIVLLQASSPLRSAKDIDNAVELLFRKKAQAVVSVSIAQHSPQYINTIGKDGSMKDFLKPEDMNRNRQELGEYYALNGAIYAATVRHLKDTGSFVGAGTYAYVMPKDRSVDIDDESDFRMADALMGIKK